MKLSHCPCRALGQGFNFLEMALQLNHLPEELLLEILDLSAKWGGKLIIEERAKLCLVCKSWDQMLNTSWKYISLHSRGEAKLKARLHWLHMVVKQSSVFLQSIALNHLQGKYDLTRNPQCLNFIDRIGCTYDLVVQCPWRSSFFSHVQDLRLVPTDWACDHDPQWPIRVESHVIEDSLPSC